MEASLVGSEMCIRDRNMEGFSDWMWLNVDDLHESSATLIKRQVSNKPTFLLPLNLFKPLSEITKRKLNEPANSNAIPATPAE